MTPSRFLQFSNLLRPGFQNAGTSTALDRRKERGASAPRKTPTETFRALALAGFTPRLLVSNDRRSKDCHPQRNEVKSKDLRLPFSNSPQPSVPHVSLLRHGKSRTLPWAVFLLAALLTPALLAQTPTVQDLAQRVDHHYNTLHSLKAAFTENYQGLGMSRSESGTLLLLKPGRMKWEYNAPPGKLFLLDGKFAWFYTPGDAQAQRIPAKQLDDLRSPLRFLLGHTELEKELTGLKLAPAPNGQFTLTGVPKGQEKRVQRLTLTVTADGSITAIEIEESDGALTRFTFTAEQPNVPIPAGAFTFTPPPGVPVVDALPPV